MLSSNSIRTDLCIVGGGMAGICAAISAARCGIKVVLVHERPVLGGNASSEIRMWVCGAAGNNRETGILEEIRLENLYRNPTKNFYIWDSVLYDFVKREKNITLLLNCTCMDANIETGDYKDGRNTRISNIKAYQMTTQTMYEISAANYADCSGDSILAPLCGAEFMWGREASDEFGEKSKLTKHDNYVMGMSCLFQARETTKKVPFIAPSFAMQLSDEDIANRPIDPIKETYQNYWYLELGGDRDTITQAEEIKDECIALSFGAWDYIKNRSKDDTKNYELEFFGWLPGKRESRRMCGEYVVTEKDISSNRIFEDTIAYGGWPLDDHFPGGFFHKGTPNTNYETPAPYTLPYRALYSKNVENLFFAGRNISMTHLAMSSVRVMATCALLGQAVGSAASLAVKYNETPNDVYKNHITELQQILLNSDCFLPHFKREISVNCNSDTLSCGDVSLFDGIDRVNKIYNNNNCGISMDCGEALSYSFKTKVAVRKVHIVFDSDLERKTLPGEGAEPSHDTRANVFLDSPQMCMPKTLVKSFELEIDTASGKKRTITVENNRTRAFDITVNDEVHKISLKPISTWGNTKANVFSFDFR